MDLCPQLIVVPYLFEQYAAVSEKVGGTLPSQAAPVPPRPPTCPLLSLAGCCRPTDPLSLSRRCTVFCCDTRPACRR